MGRKIYSNKEKAELCIQAIRDGVSETAQKHDLQRTMLSAWVKEFKESAYLVFEKGSSEEIKRLRDIIADLTIELHETK